MGNIFTGIEGYLVYSVNEDDNALFFLAFFNYEEEAEEYVNKYPGENLKIKFAGADIDFEEENLWKH